MSVAGVKTASTRSRQRSASSPTSSRASGGARVGRGGEVVEELLTVMGHAFISMGDGTAQLRRCPWRFTSEGHVADM